MRGYNAGAPGTGYVPSEYVIVRQSPTGPPPIEHVGTISFQVLVADCQTSINALSSAASSWPPYTKMSPLPRFVVVGYQRPAFIAVNGAENLEVVGSKIDDSGLPPNPWSLIVVASRGTLCPGVFSTAAETRPPGTVVP